MADHVLAMMKRDYAASFEAAKRVLEYAPDSEWSYKLAYVGQFILRFKEAEASLRSADPRRGWLQSWPAYWSLLADILHARGKYHEELQLLDEFETLFPGRSAEGRARVLVALGRPHEATKVLRAIHPLEEPRIWLDLGRKMVLEMRLHGFDPEADRLAHDLVDLWQRDLRRRTAEQDPAVQRAYGALLAESAPERATRILRALSRSDSYLPIRSNPSLVGLGVAAAKAGNRGLADSVIAVIESSPREGDDRQRIPYALATIHAALGQFDEAFMLFKEAVRESDGMISYGYHYPGNFAVSMRNYIPLREFAHPQ
jgi:tetratricopeptide (TPR) repeat protein